MLLSLKVMILFQIIFLLLVALINIFVLRSPDKYSCSLAGRLSFNDLGAHWVESKYNKIIVIIITLILIIN